MTVVNLQIKRCILEDNKVLLFHQRVVNLSLHFSDKHQSNSLYFDGKSSAEHIWKWKTP